MNKNNKMCKIYRAVLCNKQISLVVIMTCVEKDIFVVLNHLDQIAFDKN